VDNVIRHIMFAVSDENFLAKNFERTIAHRFSPTTHSGKIRAGGRLGQVHRAGPFARNQIRQIGRFLFIRPGNHQRLDGALGEHRTE